MTTQAAAPAPVKPRPTRTPNGIRRNTELMLLAVAWVVGTFTYADVGFGTEGRLPENFFPVIAGLGALLVGAHICVRILAPYADPLLLPTAAALNLLGLAMIHRLDVADRLRAIKNQSPLPSGDMSAQLVWTTLAVLLFAGVLLVIRDHRKLQRYTYTAMVAGVVLLLLPMLPVIGSTVNGATLWVQVGPLSFQPSEMAKILLAIFFAGYLVVKRDSLALVRRKFLGMGIPRGRDLGPILVAWLIALAILAVQKDLGTALMFFGLFVSLLYVSTQRKTWLIIGGVMFLIAAVLGYLAFGHVRLRVQVWLDTWTYANDSGYQIAQSLFGMANGRLLGAGLGEGYPQFVPFAKTDFIASAFAEELGLAGLAAILMLYAVFVERSLRTAIVCRDPFGKLLATGLGTVLALQVFVVIGGVTRLIPLTGLTTPWLSYGGSALVANWIMLALLLRISDRARRISVESAPRVVVKP